MCGSLSGYRSWKEIRDWYALIPSEHVKAADQKPSAVVRPTDLQPLIRLSGQERILDLGVWGFPPLKGRTSPLRNARCETMDVLPTFQESFLHRRCVVPVAAYYEFKQEVDGSKTPWRFSLRGSNPRHGAAVGEGETDLFVLAGLYMVDRVRKQRCFAIVTTEPNDIAAEVHNRMPVILDDMGMRLWLSPDTGPGGQKRLCQPYNGPGLIAEPVSKGLHKRPKDSDANQLSLGL